jgi:hypothetical protein
VLANLNRVICWLWNQGTAEESTEWASHRGTDCQQTSRHMQKEKRKKQGTSQFLELSPYEDTSSIRFLFLLVLSFWLFVLFCFVLF